MIKLERDDIQIISRHSNWSEKNIDLILKQDIYSTKAAWQKFLRLFFISLAIGFITAGILFFFAYNWADLHKFTKIGLIEGLIIITTGIVLFTKISLDIKNILLTGASVLVGVLFAVFGQVYQTGANAYDFFLGWTLCVALWVIVSNFAPLWLIFIALINTTFILYSEQVAHDWSEIFVAIALLSINVSVLISTLIIKRYLDAFNPPIWFCNTLALAVVTISTIGIIGGIFQDKTPGFYVLFVMATLLYAAGILFGLKTKSGFYLSIIPFSIIIIISAFILELSNDAAAFFFVSFFVIASVTLVIKNLLNLQKSWKN